MGTVAASTKYNTETHSIFPFSKYLLYNEVLKKNYFGFSFITAKQ